MHELAQIPPLLKRIQAVRLSEPAGKILSANLSIHPFFPMSTDVLKIHLIEAVQGTELEGIEWIIEESAGPDGPGPAEILLESVELTQ